MRTFLISWSGLLSGLLTLAISFGRLMGMGWLWLPSTVLLLLLLAYLLASVVRK